MGLVSLADIGGPPIEAVALGALLVAGLVVAGVVVLVVFVLRDVRRSREDKLAETPCPACGKPVRPGRNYCLSCGAPQPPAEADDG